MKTGYTNKSKYSLVATARRDGRHLMAVVLGAENKDVRAAVSARLLDKGFEMIANDPAPAMIVRETAVAAPVESNSQIAPQYNNAVATNTFAGAYHAATNHVPAATSGRGGPGVQFGAFSSRDAASRMITTVKSATGATPVIETAPNGLFRVRAYGLSESAAQALKTKASGAGIDCYVFH